MPFSIIILLRPDLSRARFFIFAETERPPARPRVEAQRSGFDAIRKNGGEDMELSALAGSGMKRVRSDVAAAPGFVKGAVFHLLLCTFHAAAASARVSTHGRLVCGVLVSVST